MIIRGALWSAPLQVHLKVRGFTVPVSHTGQVCLQLRVPQSFAVPIVGFGTESGTNYWKVQIRSFRRMVRLLEGPKKC